MIDNLYSALKRRRCGRAVTSESGSCRAVDGGAPAALPASPLRSEAANAAEEVLVLLVLIKVRFLSPPYSNCPGSTCLTHVGTEGKRSQRSSRPFVSVNCAAIPRDLIASELFGHEKGAFTGAIQRRLGRFELAEGGTISLDEIGELPAETQIALLHVLQEREFERVGGTGSIRTNVRVIAATNRDLQAAIAANTSGATSFTGSTFFRSRC